MQRNCLTLKEWYTPLLPTRDDITKNLLSEEFKTGMITGSKPGDVAKVLKEIVNAKYSDDVTEDTDRYRIREGSHRRRRASGIRCLC